MESAKGTGSQNGHAGQTVQAWDAVARLCREILAPMVRADGGEMYLVAATADEVHLHLSGACAGCPGSAFTRDKVLTPVLQTAVPKAKIVVTTGWRVPEGATHVIVDDAKRA